MLMRHQENGWQDVPYSEVEAMKKNGWIESSYEEFAKVGAAKHTTPPEAPQVKLKGKPGRKPKHNL